MPPIRRRQNKKIDDSSRERIIELVTDRGKTMASVASTFDIPASTVRSIIDTFLQTNRIAKVPRGGNRISRIEESHLDWLTENMDEFAGRPAQWLTDKLNEHFQIQPPFARRTVDRAINKLTIYTLRLMKAESERYNDPECIEVRRQWAENVLRGPGSMDHFVYIDEAGFNLNITRKYGRVLQGKHAIQRVPYNRGPNMSLVIAFDKTGILAYYFKRGTYNQETFTEFLEDQLFPLIKDRHRILLMDNANFHKTQRVRDATTTNGHTLLLLPPYSPHLNAADPVFSSVKTHVRQEIVQAKTLAGHVESGLEGIDAAVARGWFSEVERNFQLSLAGAPLGRLHDTRQALPEGYQDPYAEGLDAELEYENDREDKEDVDVEEEEEEEEGMVEEMEMEMEEDEDEKREKVEEEMEGDEIEEGEGEGNAREGGAVRLPAGSRYSPLRTRSGKVRN